MSEHVLSILVKAIGATQAARSLKSVDTSLAGIGSTAKRGLSTAASNIAKIGAVGIGALGLAIHTGIEDLATLEDATTQVDGAIKQLGLTGKVTSTQVAGWANEIEASVQAAFDDKDITSATATLLRFGSVTPKNLRPAMVVMTDLAAKTGDVDSAATLLGKALADPEKAAGKLARQGIVLTKTQQDQIKALVKAGKVEQAQAILLDLIAEKTKGAAAASAGPYRDALNELRDASEDARKALAIGFLPVIQRVADWLHKKLADPATIDQLKGFGQTLADGFSKLLDIVGRVPWDSVADAMKIAGMGGKALLDAFTAMPPWVQTAVISGWGLNKLTGGALGDIVGDLGKGLIKGVLGMNAGVVNINAGVVNGAGGGVGGVGGGVGAAVGGSKLGVLGSIVTKLAGLAVAAGGSALLGAGVSEGGPAGAGMGALGGAGMIGGLAVAFGPAGAIAGSIAAVGQTLFQIRDQSSHQAQDIATSINGQISGGAKLSDLKTSLAAVDTGINQIQANPLNVLVAGDALDSLHQQHDALTKVITAQVGTEAALNAAARQGQAQSADVRNAINNDKVATTAKLAAVAAAAAAAGATVRTAIANKNLSVHFAPVINTSVSVRETIQTRTTFKKYFTTAS